jgi:DNA-directed RNA polymerase subunit RPC12/RpoP
MIGDVMLYELGNPARGSFKCECGANVFRQAADRADVYVCNGCDARWQDAGKVCPVDASPQPLPPWRCSYCGQLGDVNRCDPMSGCGLHSGEDDLPGYP